MRRALRTRRSGAEEHNPYWISFTDLMTALLMVFILAVVVLVLQLTRAEQSLTEERERAEEQQNQLSKQIRTLSAAEDVRGEVVQEIARNLETQGIAVSVTDNNSVLSIPTEVLGFEGSSYEIRPDFEGRALQIGATIAQAIEADERFTYLDTVFVEGHTDNLAFTGLDGTGNWGLSAFRAISLWQLWESGLPPEQKLGEMKRPDGDPLFSVSGYGETRPATVTQNTPEEQAANRRIEIRFTVAQPTAEEFTDAVEGSDG